jgi:hypothetical protein
VNPPKSSVYIFKGNGSWDTATNWVDNHKPETMISGNKIVIIDPAINGECVLDKPLELSNGAILKVRPNKLFRLHD